MTKYLVSEYFYEDDLLSILSEKSYDNLSEIIQMISKKYKGLRHYMTLSEGDDKYIIRLNENDKICFLIEEV
tara:strand:+ start:3656 stop:3871 length:216 start_codon:yes stop_codon:yes gene_type:complete